MIDGQALKLEEIWDGILLQQHPSLTADRGMTITQADHPLLGQPFFQLHPCRTAELMSQFLPTGLKPNAVDYLRAWVSLLGPIVGLELPAELY